MTEAEEKKAVAVWGYAEDFHAERWFGRCDSREQAIKEARDKFGSDVAVYVRPGRQEPPSAFVPSVDYILENMGENAYDEAGEAAEDFPDASEEDREALQKLLETWANERLTVSFWTCDGEPERIEPEKDK